MEKMIKWPSISQFRDVVKNVAYKTRFIGLDDQENTIFDKFKTLPIQKYEGTIKLHGTCAGVAITPTDENPQIWCESRENIITPLKDNAGFAAYIYFHKDLYTKILNELYSTFTEDECKNNIDVIIWGEWCGGNIQKGIGLNQIDKMFVIFGAALINETGEKTYASRKQIANAIFSIRNESNKKIIHCIYDFKTFLIDIDFDKPHNIQNELNKITDDVELECPVAKALGATIEKGLMIGEGVVWRCIEPGYEDSGYWFKVKGDKHSKSKVKTLANVDVEKIDNINALSDQLAHTGRLDQGLQIVFNTLNGGEIDIKRTGEFIKWVISDIIKEELDTITSNGFTVKEISNRVNKLARDHIIKSI